VDLPLLGGLPLIESLSVDAAVRHADYSTFGENTTYKYGAVWAPIDDFRLRYSYSRANRVPNLFELYAPLQGQSFRPQDPCDVNQLSSAPDRTLRQANCVASLQQYNVPQSKIFDANGNYIFVDPLSAGFPGTVGGNPDLLPEVATTETFGFVFQPRFLDGFTLTMDYWDIAIEDVISTISSNNIVLSCYDSPSIDNAFCGLITRNDVPTSAQSGGFTSLRQVQLNFGEGLARGVDMNMSYRFELAGYRFNLGTAVTKQLQLDFVEPSVGGRAGNVDVQLGETRKPQWSGQLNATVGKGPYSVSLRSQYLSKQTLGGQAIETAMQNFGRAGFTKEFVSHNLSGNWDYSDTIRISGGISNLTNEKPFVTERAYPVSAVGRAYFVGLTMQM
jgi:iron complex outermembrane receptor protein